MASRTGNGFKLRQLGGLPAFLAMAVAVALLVMMLYPRSKTQQTTSDPVADAEAACSFLLGQIGAPETDQAEAPPAMAGITGATVAQDAGAARIRDLFSPVTSKPPPPAKAAPVARATEDESLQISAIFIDGTSRQALIAGQLCGAGDVVQGHRILEIDPESVLVEKDQAKYRIRLKGKS